ncbi:FliH/SctL family protein [Sphingomonas baiyangensis]|uniref:Flagellar biosynthesis protein FliH n=1 Tax=Sphingomonas baiyangensis TaxID=2572576 RepID=A0A4U1L5B7_9SPHN|nr:FliH/SctL family protein [Sphingomonas baiyangensis]TKD52002.1 flagellar biosynthesis protein FliH [Sphingomonas baiyangensis]
MSDGAFTAGFASRHAAAGEALRRAFAPPEGFAPRDTLVRAASRGGDTPRHFEPADRASRPTEGWDMFDPEVEQPAAQPFVDPVAAARAEGYAEGLRAAGDEAAAIRQRDQALLDGLAHALGSAPHFDRERFARQLRQTVLTLVTRLVGEIGIAPELLGDRIEAAVDLLADSAESAIARLHPDDVTLVRDLLPKTVFAVGDESVARGSFVLESASTIVEDGPDQWIEQLSHAIERAPLPRPC